jgi:hypothetical protein
VDPHAICGALDSTVFVVGGHRSPVLSVTLLTSHENIVLIIENAIRSDNAATVVVVKSADVLLHPVRMRIWQAFLGDRALTTGELRSKLPDVPPASLYRQIAVLVDSGVLAVAAEQRVRGAVERTYMLRAAASTIPDQELAEMTPDEHRAAFMAYMTGLLGDFDRYLAKDDIDLRRDGVGYRIAGMWLDETEFNELVRDLVGVLQPRLANAPRRGRTRRILGTIFLPG